MDCNTSNIQAGQLAALYQSDSNLLDAHPTKMIT